MKVTLSLLTVLLCTACVVSHGIQPRNDLIGYNVPAVKPYIQPRAYGYRPVPSYIRSFLKLRPLVAAGLPYNVRQLHQPAYYPREYQEYQDYLQYARSPYVYGGNPFVQNPYQYDQNPVSESVPHSDPHGHDSNPKSEPSSEPSY